jgi:glycosyltransferase involved in cell wall biosynthesis
LPRELLCGTTGSQTSGHSQFCANAIVPRAGALHLHRTVGFHPPVAHPLVLVSGLFPPLRGGLADHTRWLATHLAARHPLTLITATGAKPRPDCGEVRNVIADWHSAPALRGELSRAPAGAPVLWQYVPHMYGRGGVNFTLYRLIRELNRSGRRQLVIAHEVMAPLYLRPHWFFYGLCHRWAWRHIRRSVEAIGISTEGWLERRREQWRDAADKFFVVPSPSNFPVIPTPPDHRITWRSGLNLPADMPVIAYFGTLSASKQLGWVLDAWRHASRPDRPVALAVIGAAPPLELPPELQKWYRPLGYLDEAAVSHALQAVDVLALPFDDGVAERRTTITAGLAHGTPIVTTTGSSTGTTLRRADFFVASPVEDPAAFATNVERVLADPAEQMRLRTVGRAAYHREFSWDVVVRRIEQRLHVS